MSLPNWLQVLNAEVVNCTRCPRLVAYREQVAREKRRAYRDCEYWGKPVPGFGDPKARVLVLGLAPGAHGSNRTGRPFTGDASGNFMYPVLHETGFALLPTATARDDGQVLTGLYITAAARCAPPDNKPLPVDLANCAPFLERETRRTERFARNCCLGKNRIRRVLELSEAAERDQHQEALRISPCGPLPNAESQDPAGVVPPLQPKHEHRQADAPDVRGSLSGSKALGRSRVSRPRDRAAQPTLTS
jgi:uracil-DNA glycosylase family 4